MTITDRWPDGSGQDSQAPTKALYDQILEHDVDHLERLRKDAIRAGQGLPTGLTLHSMGVAAQKKEIPLWVPKYAITMVCARTGGGKTVLMTNLAVRMAVSGYTGFFITLEEPGFSIRAKMLASYSCSQKAPVGMKQVTSWNAAQAIAGKFDVPFMKSFDKDVMLNLRIVDANQSVDFDKIASPTLMYQPQVIANLIKYRNSRSSKPLDFVIIDFGQLMEADGADNSNSYQRMKAVMQACKNLAGGLGIAVIVGAQMQRSCASVDIWDWQPEMIRDGSDMEQAASLILAVSVDKDYHDERHNKVLRFLKNRNGPVRVAGMFNIDFEHNYIHSISREPEHEN